MVLLADLGLFIFGFILVYVAVDYLIDELEEYLENYDISPTVFGFMILGLDLEESIASIFGAIDHLPLLSIGNLVGNSIIALSIAFAIPILLLPFDSEPIPRFYYILFSVAIANLIFSLFFPSIVFVFGIIAIVLFVLILVLSIRYQVHYRQDYPSELKEEEDEYATSFLVHSLGILAILVVVIIGGEMLVRGASNIIAQTQISESFFGLVIMAFVTNVEEFWLMFNAVRSDQVELGVSAQLGKVFWNTTLVFGISALIIGGYSVDLALILSGILLLLLISVLLYGLLRDNLSRGLAITLLSMLGVFLLVNFYFLLG